MEGANTWVILYDTIENILLLGYIRFIYSYIRFHLIIAANTIIVRTIGFVFACGISL